ncbi:hypothetical protein BKM10_17625 [Pseudomonas syringae pv. syringae]|nr:hypothetical protein BKM10_17625 [Pseudomonas syringae pv. syringae]
MQMHCTSRAKPAFGRIINIPALALAYRNDGYHYPIFLDSIDESVSCTAQFNFVMIWHAMKRIAWNSW